MEKYKDLIMPLLFAIGMSIIRSLKVGRTKFIYLLTEASVSFLFGWLGYYILTEWYHISYNIVCGVCGFLGYLSPKILIGIEAIVENTLEHYKNNITKK